MKAGRSGPPEFRRAGRRNAQTAALSCPTRFSMRASALSLSFGRSEVDAGRNWSARGLHTVKEMFKDFLTAHGGNRRREGRAHIRRAADVPATSSGCCRQYRLRRTLHLQPDCPRRQDASLRTGTRRHSGLVEGGGGEADLVFSPPLPRKAISWYNTTHKL